MYIMKMTHILKSAALVALGLALFSCSKKEELKRIQEKASHEDTTLEGGNADEPAADGSTAFTITF